tara:strand:+ start:77 stop:1183 length:1107 start_codon:yes stop_codon:yes gene_type:complete
MSDNATLDVPPPLLLLIALAAVALQLLKQLTTSEAAEAELRQVQAAQEAELRQLAANEQDGLSTNRDVLPSPADLAAVSFGALELHAQLVSDAIASKVAQSEVMISCCEQGRSTDLLSSLTTLPDFCRIQTINIGSRVPSHIRGPELTALMQACRRGNVACTQILLEHRASVDQARPDGSTALWIACKHSSVACASLLLEHGAAVDLVGPGNKTAIQCVVGDSADSLALVKMLILRGASIERLCQSYRIGEEFGPPQVQGERLQFIYAFRMSMSAMNVLPWSITLNARMHPIVRDRAFVLLCIGYQMARQPPPTIPFDCWCGMVMPQAMAGAVFDNWSLFDDEVLQAHLPFGFRNLVRVYGSQQAFSL